MRGVATEMRRNTEVRKKSVKLFDNTHCEEKHIMGFECRGGCVGLGV